MTLLDAVRQFIEYEERGSRENWCEWDQHFEQLKKAYSEYEKQEAISILRNIQDFLEET